jgi:hypothetical protein
MKDERRRDRAQIPDIVKAERKELFILHPSAFILQF